MMEDSEETFIKMQDAIYEVISNTPNMDAMDSVMALCCVMCDILVQIQMDKNEIVMGAIMSTLDAARERHNPLEVH